MTGIALYERTTAALRSHGPRYHAIVDALQADIEGGMLRPGSRLLPHRDLAEHLGLSIGTVSKAYAEAERQGLIIGKVGKGTFVRARASDAASPDVERSRNENGREHVRTPVDNAAPVCRLLL